MSNRFNDAVIFVTLTALLAFLALATDLYLPAIPMMTADLGGSVSDGQLTLSIFMVGVAFGQVVFGPLSDHFGRLPVIRAGTAGFVAFSLISAFAWSMQYMWVARCLHGFAAASGPVVARAIIRDKYEGHRAAQMMAWTSASMATLPLIAPTLGAFIATQFGWRATFLALAVFALLPLAGLSAFDQSYSEGNKSGAKLTLMSVLRTFKDCLTDRRFIAYLVAGTLSFSALFIYLSTVSFFLSDVFNIPTAYFGLAFAISVVGFVIGSLTSAQLVTIWGQDQTLFVGATLCVVVSVLALTVAGNAGSLPIVLAALSTTFFFGIGLISANASMGAVSLFAHKAGAASAVYGSIHALSSATMGAIAGILYNGRLVEPIALMAVCSLLGFVGAVAVKRTQKLPV